METAEVDRLVMKPTARRRLGKYVLLGRLGAGGMGKIYLAYAPGPAGIEKLLVVKRLHSHLTGDPILVNSFLDEARLSMALNHPNIGHTYDVGEVDGRFFMVMEYIDGQNLGVLLRTAKRSGAYPGSALWAGTFLGVLDGLHAAHEARDARGRPLQIIHRDVSPQNVLVTYEGLPKLVDFGIAKAAMRVSETDAGTLKGKYAYMSPEQVRGEPLDPRSDVFAAGIVLWEMLAGRRLYKADSIVRSVERIMHEPLISPTRVNPECHPEIAQVCLKALEKDRENRFRSALEFKDALEDAMLRAQLRHRPQDLRELMPRLFGDVIDRQRAVLESCLNQTAEVAPGDDDDESRYRAGDSQSDLRMPSLQAIKEERESTTPSARRRSPIVTEEQEVRERSTRPELKRPPGRSTAAAAPTASRHAELPAATPPTAGLPPLLSRSRSSSMAAEQPITSSFPMQAAGRETFAVSDEPFDRDDDTPTRTPILLYGGALVAGVLLAVGLVFVIRGNDPPSVQVDPAPASTSSAPHVDPAQRTPPTAPTAPTTSPTTAPTSAPTPSPVVALDAGVASGGAPVVDVPSMRGADAGSLDDELPPGDPPPRAPARPDAGKGRPAVDKRPPASAPSSTTAPASAAAINAVTPAPPGEANGFLSLDTVPWTTVYLAGRKLGDTPLVNVPVPAGNLELTLVNSESGLKEGYIARVKAGEVYRARLDLQ